MQPLRGITINEHYLVFWPIILNWISNQLKLFVQFMQDQKRTKVDYVALKCTQEENLATNTENKPFKGAKIIEKYHT